MQLRHRQLQELLSDKRNRLIALGLVDAGDIDAMIPENEGGKDDRPGVGFSEGLDSDFSRLAPVLQVQLQKNGLLYTQALLRDFLALLRTRDLVVLAGDSGSGKTSLVRAAADALQGGVRIVLGCAVGADPQRVVFLGGDMRQGAALPVVEPGAHRG